MPIKSFNASQRMRDVQPPIISIVSDLIKKNPGTVSLGQGVVYYGPPQKVINKISELDPSPGYHIYSEVEGISKLRSIASKKITLENKININKNSELIVTAGSNMAFMNAILAIADPDDEIILLRPYYFNHEMAINMINCKSVIVDTDSNYQPCLKKIAEAITSQTKAIVTVSPNNPSGAVYERKALEEINKLCKEKGIYHISDEAYEYFTFGGINHFSPGSIPDSCDYTISLFSLSKAYGFASWRIGYMVIPKHLSLSIKKASTLPTSSGTSTAKESTSNSFILTLYPISKNLNISISSYSSFIVLFFCEKTSRAFLVKPYTQICFLYGNFVLNLENGIGWRDIYISSSLSLTITLIIDLQFISLLSSMGL